MHAGASELLVTSLSSEKVLGPEEKPLSRTGIERPPEGVGLQKAEAKKEGAS